MWSGSVTVLTGPGIGPKILFVDEGKFRARPSQRSFCKRETFFQFSRGLRRHVRIVWGGIAQDLKVIGDTLQLIHLLIATDLCPCLEVKYNRNDKAPIATNLYY